MLLSAFYSITENFEDEIKLDQQPNHTSQQKDMVPSRWSSISQSKFAGVEAARCLSTTGNHGNLRKQIVQSRMVYRSTYRMSRMTDKSPGMPCSTCSTNFWNFANVRFCSNVRHVSFWHNSFICAMYLYIDTIRVGFA